MEVGVHLSEAKIGKFSNIILSFNALNGKEQKVGLVLNNFVDIYDLTRDTKSPRFDFFLISALVYGIDNLLDREYYSDDGWSREIEVVLPVYNISIWKGQESLLEESLKFLTGDHWKINFVHNPIQNCFLEKKGRWNKKRKTFNTDKIKVTSLFSGGLDSLIGIIDHLEKLNNDEEILLVSHFDFYSSGPNRDQQILFRSLVEKYPDKVKNNWIQSRLALKRVNQYGDKFKTEGNYRSRSFFFIGLGCLLSPSSNLIIPENGTISINYPLTPSRVSSLSTRTTHPFVLGKLQQLLYNLEIAVALENPYRFKTKGEMVKECQNNIFLEEIHPKSTSCGKSNHKENWENRTGTHHCGVCMPCIYRRAALHKNNNDDQLYGSYVEKAVSRNRFVDLPALINFLKKNIDKEQMKRDILVNGNVPTNDLENYAEMVLRSKDEVLKLFRDKGNDFIKNEIGINDN
ncbi:Qat anti-phage system QueC-like protein QatC [uncultured Christiangramia sp.]|uniref:Qat anti-phage system QueC-like protein QatC n=1 Tax=Christiangramia sp. 3-2217-3z TaxID=3417564 RepID=UPI00260EC832|nr:Qat anti-phage system QueC-like protein QatC [uncultured Christiangramia sp.]